MTPAPSDRPVSRLFATPSFVRLWAAGGIGTAMRWVETLVTGVFTYEVTASAFIVAVVLMTRSLPMLLGGALAGVLAESQDRRHMLLAFILTSLLSTAAVAGLMLAGQLAVWHLALNGFLGGLAYAVDMATRRRMVLESAETRDMAAAVAIDTMTGSATRMLGPLAGGLLYDLLGLAPAFLIACAGHAVALLLVLRVAHAQEIRPMVSPRRLLAEIHDAWRVAWRIPALAVVLGVTAVTNVFAFSYSSVLPALGAALFGAGPVGIGLLAAAEPAGAMLAGLAMALLGRAPLKPSAMAAGSAAFLVGMMLMVAAPNLAVAWVVLALGGLGTAVFASLQTALVILHAPPEARSRVLGLTTTCIGLGPIGVLAMGALADSVGAAAAVLGMAVCGLVGLVAALRYAARQG
jgi:MFS family permease